MPGSVDPFDFTGKVAVITGGGTGIGRATALLFAERGAAVVLASRRTENLDKVAAEVTALGGRALAVTTDVRREDDCERLIEQSAAAFGRLDILVNNAGGSRAVALEEWTVASFANMVDLNLRSVFILSIAALPHLRQAGGGAIVNVSSGAGQLGLPFVASYGTAKAGVNNLTRTLAGAWGPDGIRVNCVAVGAVKSEGFVREMERIGRDPDEVGGSSNAVGRAGDPVEIAWPILFLASGASSFLSGETIYVGGGPAVPRFV